MSKKPGAPPNDGQPTLLSFFAKQKGPKPRKRPVEEEAETSAAHKSTSTSDTPSSSKKSKSTYATDHGRSRKSAAAASHQGPPSGAAAAAAQKPPPHGNDEVVHEATSKSGVDHEGSSAKAPPRCNGADIKPASAGGVEDDAVGEEKRAGRRLSSEETTDGGPEGTCAANAIDAHHPLLDEDGADAELAVEDIEEDVEEGGGDDGLTEEGPVDRPGDEDPLDDAAGMDGAESSDEEKEFDWKPTNTKVAAATTKGRNGAGEVGGPGEETAVLASSGKEGAVDHPDGHEPEEAVGGDDALSGGAMCNATPKCAPNASEGKPCVEGDSLALSRNEEPHARPDGMEDAPLTKASRAPSAASVATTDTTTGEDAMELVADRPYTTPSKREEEESNIVTPDDNDRNPGSGTTPSGAYDALALVRVENPDAAICNKVVVQAGSSPFDFEQGQYVLDGDSAAIAKPTRIFAGAIIGRPPSDESKAHPKFVDVGIPVKAPGVSRSHLTVASVDASKPELVVRVSKVIDVFQNDEQTHLEPGQNAMLRPGDAIQMKSEKQKHFVFCVVGLVGGVRGGQGLGARDGLAVGAAVGNDDEMAEASGDAAVALDATSGGEVEGEPETKAAVATTDTSDATREDAMELDATTTCATPAKATGKESNVVTPDDNDRDLDSGTTPSGTATSGTATSGTATSGTKKTAAKKATTTIDRKTVEIRAFTNKNWKNTCWVPNCTKVGVKKITGLRCAVHANEYGRGRVRAKGAWATRGGTSAAVRESYLCYDGEERPAEVMETSDKSKRYRIPLEALIRECDHKLLDDYRKVYNESFGVEADREASRAYRSRERGDADAPERKYFRRANTNGESCTTDDGSCKCVEAGCPNPSFYKICGILCGSCAVAKWAPGGWDEELRAYVCYIPGTDYFAYVPLQNCGGSAPAPSFDEDSFAFLAWGHLIENSKDWETRKEQFLTLKRNDAARSAAKKAAREAESESVQEPASADRLAQELEEAQSILDSIVKYDDAFNASKGRYNENTKKLDGNEAVAHMIRPYRNPKYIKEDGTALTANDLFEPDGILYGKVECHYQGIGTEKIALDTEQHLQSNSKHIPGRVFEVTGAGQRGGKRKGKFGVGVVVYKDLLKMVREEKGIVLSADMSPKERARYEAYPGIEPRHFREPAFDHHKKMAKYNAKRKAQKKAGLIKSGESLLKED